MRSKLRDGLRSDQTDGRRVQRQTTAVTTHIASCMRLCAHSSQTSTQLPCALHHYGYSHRSHHPTIAMSRKAVAAAAPLPEMLLLGCEGVGKSCLTRQMKRCAHTDCDEDVNLAAAPTVALTEQVQRDANAEEQSSRRCTHPSLDPCCVGLHSALCRTVLNATSCDSSRRASLSKRSVRNE